MRSKHIWPDEHSIQSAFHQLILLHQFRYEELQSAFAVPNGELRDKRVARRLKEEGVRPGVPDWILPVKATPYIGFAIEFKTKIGRLTHDQKSYHALMRKAGWMVQVHQDAEKAWFAVKEYLGIGKNGERLTSGVIRNIVP